MGSKHRFQEALLQLALQPRRLAKSLGQLVPAAASQGLSVAVLDGRWLKLLQAHGRSVAKVAAIPIEGKGPEEIAKALQDHCAAEHVALHDVLLANPTHLSTIRVFTLPSVDANEIRDIVELQAEKHTPYAKEEILLDFAVLDRERAGYSRVLLVIAHQDVVHRSVRVMELSNLLLERVACEVEGLVQWFQMVRRRVSTPGAGPTLVIDVDGSTTTLLVMQRGQLVFQRNFALGMEHLHRDPAAASQRLIAELQRSVEAVEAEGSASKIQDIVMTGRVERLQELKTAVESAFGLPVNLAAPWGAMELAEEASTAAERLPEISFASLVGLAAAPSRIDLTPKATKLRQAFEARARSLVVMACQGLGVLLLISLLIMGRAQQQHRYYETLQALYNTDASEAFDIEQGLASINFIRERLRHRGELLNLVDGLVKLSPREVQWDALTYTQAESLIVKGESNALPKVYEFAASLSNSALFTDVPPPKVSQRKGGADDEQGITDFELRCSLVPPKPGRGTPG
ncbi:MAG: pilus assembly protein PilM [Candidatus Omnitrophica bacterium]|nr:pilus assembly protein PilM [Candidatus Omnitrophota bacterium]